MKEKHLIAFAVILCFQGQKAVAARTDLTTMARSRAVRAVSLLDRPERLLSLQDMEQGAPQPADDRASALMADETTALLVFGGQGHKVFLGCLTCDSFSSASVDNPFGKGSGPESVWNHASEYGSMFSTYSACNAFAGDPPVIVDLTGRLYGRLTLNESHPEIGIGRRLQQWLKNRACR